MSGKVFVGRQGELAAMLRYWQTAVQGEGETLFVVGEMGVGKTALVQEFAAHIRRISPTSLAAYAKCEVSSSNESFGVAIQALQDLVASQGRGDAKRSRPQTTLAEIISQAAPSWLPLIPIIGQPVAAVIDLYNKARQNLGAAPEPLPRTMLHQFQQLVARLTTTTAPLLLIFDDMQWADPSSVGLVNYLAEAGRRQRLLQVVVYRTDDAVGAQIYAAAAEMRRNQLCQILELPLLPEENRARLLEAFLPGQDLPADVVKALLAKSAGNPLFLEQIVLEWKENGALSREQGRWRLTRAAQEIEIPQSLRGILDLRIRRLPETLHRTMLRAAVIGERFNSKLAAELLGEGELEVVERLRAAERDYLLLRQIGAAELPGGTITTEFAFAHPFLHQFLYQELTATELIGLHRMTVDALENLWQDRRAEIAGRLAFHSLAAHDWRRGSEYLALLAEQARSRYANDDALASYNSALDLLGHQLAKARDLDGLRGRIHAGRGDLFELQGNTAAAIAEHRLALELFTSARDEKAQALQLIHLVRTACVHHNYSQALDDVKRAFETFDRLALPAVERLEALALAGWVYVDVGEPQSRVREVFSEAERLIDQLDSPIALYYANEVGFYYRRFGPYERCEEISRRTHEMSLRYQDRRGEQLSLRDLGFCSLVRGRLVTATHQLQKALTLAREIGATHDEGLILDDLALLAAATGSFEESLRRRREALERFRGRDDEWHTGYGLARMGLLYERLGRHDEAVESCRRSLALFESIRSRHRSVWAAACLGFVERDPEKILAAIAGLEGMEDRVRSAEAYRSLARVYREADEPERARDAINRALSLHRPLGSVIDMIEDLREVAVLATAATSREEALKELEGFYRALEVAGDPALEGFQQAGLDTVARWRGIAPS